jgi:hypothetical protein
MVLEMVFQVVSSAALTTAHPDVVTIVETITSRVLDGSNLCLFSLTLLYLYSFQEQVADEDAFFSEQKVNLANKALINLFRYFHLVLLKLHEQELAIGFLRSIICTSSEVYVENVGNNHLNEAVLVMKAKTKGNSTTLQDYNEFLETISDARTKTKQFSAFLSTLKKAYYTIAMREAHKYADKLEVINSFIRENVDIGPSDTDMLDSLVLKINTREEFDTHLKLFHEMLHACKVEDARPSYLCFIFLMMTFEEICEFCRRHNDLQVLIKLFLEVQFIRFPYELVQFRKYKSLVIKYFPFYMMKNLSFLTNSDPVKEIIDKHYEFKKIFEEVSRPIKIDGIDVGLVNPLDLIESKKMKTLISSDLSSGEHILDMLRLEIEIWENFIYQISHFDKTEKRNYQCMLRSVVFHSFLKMFSKLKKKKQKITLGNFLQNLCIHNDDLVKLILRQGFDDTLISDAVEYIEWFHVCLIYCDMLLSNTFESKKLHFYYRLLTETIKKYPAQISKDVARSLIVNHFAYVELNPEENQVVLESIRTILETFPSLDQERLFLIQHYRNIQKDLCVFDISFVYIDRLTKELEKITSK